MFLTGHHLPAVILAYFGGKKKFQTRNFYASETVEYVPEKPLGTHHDKTSSDMSDSSVSTMGIFP